MKAVILQICPSALIVDISHSVPSFDVPYAAYILSETTPFFPAGSIHVAVVDPGVGTERLPIVVRTRRYLFIGPDNGLLSIAAERDGDALAWAIENPKYTLEKPSATFHGRDIFAPVAAHLARGLPPESMGRRLASFQKLSLPEPLLDGDELQGKVLFVDPFGNLVTNILPSMLAKLGAGDGALTAQVGGTLAPTRLLTTYGEAKQGEPLLVVGSSGLVEIAVNRGSAARFFQASRGAVLVLRRLR